MCSCLDFPPLIFLSLVFLSQFLPSLCASAALRETSRHLPHFSVPPFFCPPLSSFSCQIFSCPPSFLCPLCFLWLTGLFMAQEQSGTTVLQSVLRIGGTARTCSGLPLPRPQATGDRSAPPLRLRGSAGNLSTSSSSFFCPPIFLSPSFFIFLSDIFLSPVFPVPSVRLVANGFVHGTRTVGDNGSTIGPPHRRNRGLVPAYLSPGPRRQAIDRLLLCASAALRETSLHLLPIFCPSIFLSPSFFIFLSDIFLSPVFLVPSVLLVANGFVHGTRTVGDNGSTIGPPHRRNRADLFRPTSPQAPGDRR